MSKARSKARPSRSPSPGVLAVLVGFAGGLSVPLWSVTLQRSLVDTPGADITFATLALVAFALGARQRRLPEPRRLAGALIAVGGLAITLATLPLDLARGLAWAGGGLDASPVGIGVARALISSLFLLPASWVAGRVIATVLREVTPERAAGTAGALVAAGLTGAAFAATPLPGEIARVLPSGAARPLVGLLAGIVTLLAGALVARTRFSAPDAAENPRGFFFEAAAWGFAIALPLTVFGLATRRAFVAIVGNDLPGVDVAGVVFVGAAAGGAILAAALGARLTHRFRAVAVVLLVAASGAIAITVLTRWAALPERFHAKVLELSSLAAVARTAFDLALPRIVPLALPLGAAAVLGARFVPATRADRRPWVESATIGLGLGVVVGLGMGASRLATLALGHLVTSATLTAVVIATVALVRRADALRLATAVIALGVVAAAALRVPPLDREALVVERSLRSEASFISGVQQHWRIFDEDGPEGTWTILARGHERRLFVNGRFETSTGTSIASHGLLAHLPLSTGPEAKRVCVLGSGSGVAIRAALSHPIDRLDVLDVGRVPFRATARLGPVERTAMQDPRVSLYPGDPHELLRRAAAYDVILGQASGAWTARSARFSTREFLRVVRERLTESGRYCHWVPASSLTREGFLDLLATFADVFPQVECWAGESGDVLILARRTPAPIDFPSVAERWMDPTVLADTRASWIGTPDTMLSRFLIGDATVRRIAGNRPPHRALAPSLAGPEADRRHRETTVNAVPGLVALGDDPLAAVVDAPAGLRERVERDREALAKKWEAVDLEIAGQDLDAIAAYREALGLNPEDGSIRRAFAGLRSRMGIQYTIREAFSGAHSNMREAVEIDSTYAPGFANLGWLLMQGEQFDYAIACTGQAIELEPEDDLFRLQMGRIWKRRGYFDKALPFYEDAVRLNPRNIDAAIGYIDCKLSMEDEQADLQFGLEFLERYLALDPEHEELQYRIGKLKDAMRRDETGESPFDHRPPTPGVTSPGVDDHEGHDHGPASDHDDTADATQP
ncbi:MAG: hypothetical protein R3B81_04470 [bacterium]